MKVFVFALLALSAIVFMGPDPLPPDRLAAHSGPGGGPVDSDTPPSDGEFPKIQLEISSAGGTRPVIPDNPPPD